MAGDLERQLKRLVGAREWDEVYRMLARPTRKGARSFGTIDEAFANELAAREPWLDFDGELYEYSFGEARPFDDCPALARAGVDLAEAVRDGDAVRVRERAEHFVDLAVERFAASGLLRAFAESVIDEHRREIADLKRDVERLQALVDDRSARLARRFEPRPLKE